MKFTTCAIAISALLATVGTTSLTLADEISDRQLKMKVVGRSIGVVSKMAKGEANFDPAIALQAFVNMKEAAEGYEDLFPEGTETGGETEAGPAIFTDRAGFEAKHADFEAALEKVTAAEPADLAELRVSLGEVGANCGICHKAYRVKN